MPLPVLCPTEGDIKTKTYYDYLDMFTYNIQLAGYPHDKWDEMGETTFEGFKTTFEEFPWAGCKLPRSSAIRS
jgi:hypothetical protein